MPHGTYRRRLAGAVAIAAALSGAASSVSAQGVALHFDADRTDAVEGEVIRWTVSASFTGYPGPGAYFGGFFGNFIASDGDLGTAQNPVGLLSSDTGANTTFRANVRNIAVSNLALLGTDDPSNPIPLFEFEIVAGNPGADSALSYNAFGDARVYPDNGLFTNPDDYDAFGVTSDEVLIRTLDLGLSLVLTPDRASAGYGEPVVWTASLEVSGGQTFTLDAVSGTLDAALAVFPPEGAVPLAGGAASLAVIDEDSWSFACTPDPAVIEGPASVDLFSFEAPFRVPGAQSFDGTLDAQVEVFGRVTSVEGSPVATSASVDGPALPVSTIALTPTTPRVGPNETGTFRAVFSIEGTDNQNVTLRTLSGEIIPSTLQLVDDVDLVPLIGSLNGLQTGSSGRVNGYTLALPDIPVGDGSAIEVFDLLPLFGDQPGTVEYAGTGSSVLTINGIDVQAPAVYESTAPIDVGFDFEFSLRLVPRSGSVEQGDRVRVDAIVEVSPDAPRVHSLEILRAVPFSAVTGRVGSESGVRNPSVGVFENFDEVTGDPIITDDSFVIGTDLYAGFMPGEVPTDEVVGAIRFFGDPLIEVDLRNIEIETQPFTVVERAASPFDQPGVAALELLDERTLLVGAPLSSGPGGEIRVLDATDPDAPALVATIAPPSPEAAPGFGGHLDRDGAIVVASGGDRMYLYDLSDPSTPVYLASVDGRDGEIGAGLLVVRAIDANGELETFDVADPANPASLGRFAPSANEAASGFASWGYGDGAVVVSATVSRIEDPVCCASSDCGNCLELWDAYGAVYDAATGAKITDFEPMLRVAEDLGRAESADIVVSGDTAFVAYFIDPGVGIFERNTVYAYDLAQTGPIAPSASIRSTFPLFETDSRFGVAMDLDGDRLAVGSTQELDLQGAADPLGGWFSLFDVSGPAEPSVVSAFAGAPWIAAPPSAWRPIGFGEVFSIEGDTVALANTDDGRVTIERFESAIGCNDSDLATPFGVLDGADVGAFVDAFLDGAPLADLTGEGTLDLGDIVAFVGAFGAGCP